MLGSMRVLTFQTNLEKPRPQRGFFFALPWFNRYRKACNFSKLF